jgi:hypothetical protein
MDLLCDDFGYNFYHNDVPAEGTVRAISILEPLVKSTDHPFVRHLYIHIVEPSSTPGRAKEAADELREQFNNTDSQHLQHMSGHTYLRMGLYDKVVEVSLVAVATDKRYQMHGDAGYSMGHNGGKSSCCDHV